MPYKRGSKRKAPSTKAPSTKARATQARRTPDSDKQAPAEPSSSEPSAGTTSTDQPRVLRQSSKKQEIATEEARQLREQVEKLKKQLKNAKAKAPPRNSVTQARSDDYADQPSPVESEEGSEVDDNRPTFTSLGIVATAAPPPRKLRRVGDPKHVASALPPSSELRHGHPEPRPSQAIAEPRHVETHPREQSLEYEDDILDMTNPGDASPMESDVHDNNATPGRGRSMSSSLAVSEHGHKHARSPSLSSAISEAHGPIDDIGYISGTMPKIAKPKNTDYVKSTRLLINAACDQYNLNLLTVDAFPKSETAAGWALSSWNKACTDARPQRTFADEDSARVHSLIIARGSTFRGHLRDKLRPYIIDEYGIRIDTASETARVANKEQYERLLTGSPPWFCYKHHEENRPREGYAELALLMRALGDHAFKSKTDLGTRFQTQFNPMPVPTIALLLTMVEFCLDAWKHGELIRGLEFTEASYREKYTVHLSHVSHWAGMCPALTTKLRVQMFKSAASAIDLGPAPPDVGFTAEAEAQMKEELARRNRDVDDLEDF